MDDDHRFIHPQTDPPQRPPSAASMALARRLIAEACQGSRDEPAERPLSEADIVYRYTQSHQPTLYADGHFWRCPVGGRWIPVPETMIAKEVLNTLHRCQAEGPAPTRARVAAVIDLLRLDLDRIEPGHFDNPAGFIPLHSHLVNLSNGELTPLEPEHYVATTLPYDYDRAAQATHWQRFLQSRVPNDADFIQEFAGYCLTTDTHLEQSLWVYGPSTCGKSTLLHGLLTLLGPRAADIPLTDLARRRLDPAVIAGKTLLVSHESPTDLTTAGALSSIVAGETLHLERSYRSSLAIQSPAKLALSFKTLPMLDVRYASLYHRAALVVIPPLHRDLVDKTLKDRIGAEGPGLFNWAVAGLARLKRRGRFEPPATMLAAAQRLQLAQASPAAFLAERCQAVPNTRTQAQHLHRAYVTWCTENGLQPISAKALSAEWQRLGFERQHHREGNFWCGLALLPNADDTPAGTALPAVTTPSGAILTNS